jgi:hypothetical protein
VITTRLSLRLFAIPLLAMVMSLFAPVDPVYARNSDDPGRYQMNLSNKQRQQIRRGISEAIRHRPGRPPIVNRPGLGGGIIAGEIRREIRKEVRRRYFGRVVAGVVLGSIIRVVVAGTPPGPPPSRELCWVWSNSERTRGYWYYC